MSYDYDELYRSAQRPPWEIGGPQPAVAAAVERGGLRGPRVLDVGCGTGGLALALADRGYDVTGVDVSAVAIDQARARATAAGQRVRFEVADATRLDQLDATPFDSIVDSGLLHSLHRVGGDGAEHYLAQLPALAAPAATVIVLAVSAADGAGWGVTEPYLRAAFAEPHWRDTTVKAIAVAAQVDGEPLALPGFLLQTVRSDAPPST